MGVCVGGELIGAVSHEILQRLDVASGRHELRGVGVPKIVQTVRRFYAGFLLRTSPMVIERLRCHRANQAVRC